MYEHTGFRIYLKCSTIGCKTGLKLCGDPGARALPNTVAPMRSISGFFVRMMSAAKERGSIIFWRAVIHDDHMIGSVSDQRTDSVITWPAAQVILICRAGKGSYIASE